LNSLEPDIISPKVALEPEPLEILQRSGRKKKRGTIGKINNQSAAIRLGEFAPPALRRQKSQIVLPASNSLRL
jgi:hypothetical protein